MTDEAKLYPDLAFDPDRPIAWTPIFHSNVTARPWAPNEPRGYKRAAGMFDADGSHIPGSHCWRYEAPPLTIVPEGDDTPPQDHLPGRWLFGGMFYAHFGHFLVESTARLWALDREDLGQIDGIFFFPKQHRAHEFRDFKPYQPFFERLGLSHLQVRLPQVPVTIEQITFPPPAFGIGGLIAARPDYRAFMRSRLTEGVPPAGPGDLYISRSGLNSKRGRIVSEDHIEELMTRAGYTIFHPQGHSVADQIAHYRAARRIVAFDGSALHLAAMVVAPETKVAIINRGPSTNVEDYLLQFETFAGVRATRIEAIAGYWAPTDRRFVKREAQARLDVAATGAALAEGGFITDTTDWVDPPEEQMLARINALSEAMGAPLDYKEIG